jgi:hypothetical protein
VVLLITSFFYGIKIITFCNHDLNNIIMFSTKTLKSTLKSKSDTNISTIFYFIFEVKNITFLKPLDLTINTIATKTLKPISKLKNGALSSSPLFNRNKIYKFFEIIALTTNTFGTKFLRATPNQNEVLLVALFFFSRA